LIDTQFDEGIYCYWQALYVFFNNLPVAYCFWPPG